MPVARDHGGRSRLHGALDARTTCLHIRQPSEYTWGPLAELQGSDEVWQHSEIVSPAMHKHEFHLRVAGYRQVPGNSCLKKARKIGATSGSGGYS